MNMTYSAPVCGWLYQVYNFISIINQTEQNELKRTDIPATFLLSGQKPAQRSHCLLGGSSDIHKETNVCNVCKPIHSKKEFHAFSPMCYVMGRDGKTQIHTRIWNRGLVCLSKCCGTAGKDL